jgi:hypothetical protein
LPYAIRLHEFCPDYSYAITDLPGPPPALVRVMDELLEMEASGAGWKLEGAKLLLGIAIEELRVLIAAWDARQAGT